MKFRHLDFAKMDDETVGWGIFVLPFVSVVEDDSLGIAFCPCVVQNILVQFCINTYGERFNIIISRRDRLEKIDQLCVESVLSVPRLVGL